MASNSIPNACSALANAVHSEAPPHFEIDAAFEDGFGRLGGGGGAEEFGHEDSDEDEDGADDGASVEAFADHEV